MNRLWLVAGISILWVSLTMAQEPRFIDHDIEEIKNPKFFSLPGRITHGQPIRTLLQDSDGLIWIGTDKGLASYDGNSLQLKDLAATDSLVRVTSLFEDDAQRIWVGTASGEIYYLDPDRKPHLFQPEEGRSRMPITDISQDAKGYIWIATYGDGAYVYAESRLYRFDQDDNLTDLHIYAIESVKNGEVWLATDDGINICTFDRATEKKGVKILGIADGLPDQIITAINSDPKGNIWIGTMNKGVVTFDQGIQKITMPFVSPTMENITSFTFFDEDEVWIGTGSTGVWRYSPFLRQPRKLENLNRITKMHVTDMLCDTEGNIWIVTEEGMMLSSIRSFESIELPVADTIQALYADRTDRLWIGTKKGLYRLEPGMDNKLVRVVPNFDFNIADLHEDQFHHLWIGTLDKGLYILDLRTNNVRHIGSIFSQGGITIMSMAASSKSIWIATLEGVVSFPVDKNITQVKNPTFELLSDPWKSSMNFVYQVYIDSKDRAWFATDGEGVFCIDEEKVIPHTGTSQFPIKTVYSVCEDPSGHIWFNTPDYGLIEFTGTDYKPLGLNEGLRNLNLASVLVAGNGNLVITHNYGIDILEPGRGHFMYYGEEIGINETEAGLNSVTKDSHGNIYTSGANMVYKYHSGKKSFSIHPQTQITEISVYYNPVNFASDNVFSSNQNFITFNYIGLWYTSPSSVNYQYKLDGYDLEWKQSKDNKASYSKLSPGTYTFYVKASENRFFLDEPVASYSFVIERPFWQKWWFLLLLIICAASGLYWLVKSREKRSERQALLKKERIESQLTALKAQINPHFLFNSFNTLITIIDENAMKPEVAIEYVEKLSDFYRSILQYREQETISLQEERELVQNFIYLLEKRYGNNLRLHMDPPPKDSYILPMTLQMLVENAVKHNIISDKQPLDLFIRIEKDGYVTVTNNLQPKSRTEPSTQFGLQSIIKRYQLLSERKVIVHQDQNTFNVSIPIIKKSGT